MNDQVIKEARDMIAGFIVNRRQELGYTQAELAERAGLGRATVERIEGRKFLPDGKSLLKLCHALDCYFFFAEKESDDTLVKAMRRRWQRPGQDN